MLGVNAARALQSNNEMPITKASVTRRFLPGVTPMFDRKLRQQCQDLHSHDVSQQLDSLSRGH
jgi:hypothetical protein